MKESTRERIFERGVLESMPGPMENLIQDS